MDIHSRIFLQNTKQKKNSVYVRTGDNAPARRGHEGRRVTSDDDRPPCRGTAGKRREHEPSPTAGGDSVLPDRTERSREAQAGGGSREQPEWKDGHVAGAGDSVRGCQSAGQVRR